MMKKCLGIKILSLKGICENLTEVLQKDIVHTEIIYKEKYTLGYLPECSITQ